MSSAAATAVASPIVYNAALMRPDLFRGIAMVCAPPTARGAVSPRTVWARLPEGLSFYQRYLATPEVELVIMSDVRSFLLGIYYSASAACSKDEQWRWVWPQDEEFTDTYTVPGPVHGVRRCFHYGFARVQPAAAKGSPAAHPPRIRRRPGSRRPAGSQGPWAT